MRFLFSFLLFLLLSFHSAGQVDTWIDARGKAGFLVAHRSIMGHLASEHAFATELSFIKRGKGEKAWHEGYGYPTYGFTGFFGSTGNRELLGYTIGGYTFMSMPLIRYKSYTMSGKIGVGIGYSTKVYDPSDSLLILSMAISSRFNAMVCLGLESRFEFKDHSLTLGIDMTHFSNGASKVPNLGLNLPFLSLGYGYRIKKAVNDTTYHHNKFEPYWQFGGVGIVSSKEIFPTGGKQYPVYAASALGRRYFKRNVGMEVSFDFISKQAIYGYRTEIPKTQSEIIQLGVFAGYLLPLDHLHFVIGMGYYVRDKFQPEDPMYHRVGLRYIFDSGLNLNLVLKSHWARADYIEYGIGYTFNR
jgi:hypothetical protein